MRMFGFEALIDGVWTADACGQQGPSNYLDTLEEAEAELPSLAATLECDVAALRVVSVEV